MIRGGIALLIWSAIILSACGPIRLYPDKLGTIVASERDISDAFYCGPDHGALGLPVRPDPPDEQAVAGFYNKWDPGTQPFPCYEYSSTRYLTAVKFPLEDPALVEPFRTRDIEKAELGFVFVPHGIESRITHPIGHETCPLRVYRATEAWEGGLTHFARSNPEADVEGTGTSAAVWAIRYEGPQRWWVDVTEHVQAWDDGAIDHGFIIKPPEDWPFRKNNDRCLALLQDFQLKIEFTSD